jgi:purine-nucleoside phosphorylase
MKTDREESIVRPRAVRAFGRPGLVCIPFDPVPDVLLAHLRKRASKERRLGGSALFLLPETTVLYNCLGAPATVAGLEPLIASGVERILVLSFCGSLHPGIRIGDVVSVSAAAADEGSSRRYLPGRRSFRPSAEFRRKTESRLDALGLPFLAARCVSTDTPYRETPSWLRAMRGKRLGVVDMEVSAVFALAEFHGIEAAAILLVSDELFSGRWKVASGRAAHGERIRDFFLPFL